MRDRYAFEGKPLEWPRWSNWAVIAIVLGSIATIAATLNDIW
jgi:hypothetical protein